MDTYFIVSDLCPDELECTLAQAIQEWVIATQEDPAAELWYSEDGDHLTRQIRPL